MSRDPMSRDPLMLSLNMIKAHTPCQEGWKQLLKAQNKTKADDTLFGVIEIVEANSIQDAIWCLRCFAYPDYCLFLADIAESVLPIYEARYPEDMRPREAIQIIRKQRKTNAIAAADAAYAAYADADAADAAYAAHAAADAAYAAHAADAYAAYAAHAADAVASHAAAAHAAHAAHAAAAAAAAAALKQKWKEITNLFIAHFS